MHFLHVKVQLNVDFSLRQKGEEKEGKGEWEGKAQAEAHPSLTPRSPGRRRGLPQPGRAPGPQLRSPAVEGEQRALALAAAPQGRWALLRRFCPSIGAVSNLSCSLQLFHVP